MEADWLVGHRSAASLATNRISGTGFNSLPPAACSSQLPILTDSSGRQICILHAARKESGTVIEQTIRGKMNNFFCGFPSAFNKKELPDSSEPDVELNPPSLMLHTYFRLILLFVVVWLLPMRVIVLNWFHREMISSTSCWNDWTLAKNLSERCNRPVMSMLSIGQFRLINSNRLWTVRS